MLTGATVVSRFVYWLFGVDFQGRICGRECIKGSHCFLFHYVYFFIVSTAQLLRVFGPLHFTTPRFRSQSAPTVVGSKRTANDKAVANGIAKAGSPAAKRQAVG